jgi:glutathione S-transferase
MPMQLYYSDVLMPRKACALARHLNAPVEFIYLDLGKGEHRTPDYLGLNPNGKVPTLVDGERAIWESDAILCHLSEQTGAGLWPHDSARQIEVLRWLSWGAQHFNRAAGALYFEYVIKPRFSLGAPDPAAVETAQAEFRAHAAVLDGHLKGREWLAGDSMTVADFAVPIALPYAVTAYMPIEDFPEVARWHRQLNRLEAWRDPFPARMAGGS